MVLRLLILASAFFLASCHSVERDNPLDPDGVNYAGDNLEVVLSSSSSSSISSSSSSANSSSSSAPPSNNNSSSSSVPSSNSMVDYGGGPYETVLIGTQTWFKRNLNYNVSGSKCYNNITDNCTTYGRLYNWVTAMNLPANCDYSSCSSKIQTPHQGICPSGWHIPSNADWSKLIRYVDGTNSTSNLYESYTAGKYLKAKSGWEDSGWEEGGNGEDKYGFSAQPGGFGLSSSFYKVGYEGNWWSSSAYDDYYAYSWQLDYIVDYVGYYKMDKPYFYSVRCLKD